MSDDIHPFHIAIPDADLEDLHERLARTRWPHALPGVGWERGVPPTTSSSSLAYWRDDYDWRAQEARSSTRSRSS